MKKLMKRIMILAVSSMLLVSIPLTARAQSLVTYNGKTNTFAFAPGSDASATDLFISFKNAMPGDTITQDLVVISEAPNQKVRIYLRAIPAKEEEIPFLDELELRVEEIETAAGSNKVFFDAPAGETNSLTEWNLLGTFYNGQSTKLLLTLSVPATMGNEFQDAVGTVIWEFRAEGYALQQGDPGYKTGDININLILGAVFLSNLFVLLVLIAKHKKEQEK